MAAKAARGGRERVGGQRQSLVFRQERRATLTAKLVLPVFDAAAGKGKLRWRCGVWGSARGECGSRVLFLL